MEPLEPPDWSTRSARQVIFSLSQSDKRSRAVPFTTPLGRKRPKIVEPPALAGERDVADRHRARDEAAALAVGGAAVHEAEIRDLVPVHDGERDAAPVLGLARGIGPTSSPPIVDAAPRA